MIPQFSHLHVHTHYSLLDGLASPLELATGARKLKQPALAITDHGNMFGAINFYKSCKDIGIKPIIGIETYIAPESRLDKKSEKGSIVYHHLTLLAKNKVGYQNLMQLSTIGYLEGFYYRPRIDLESLIKYKEGLICLSGCLYSQLSKHIIKGEMKEAKEWIEILRKAFGQDFYIEMQDLEIPEQKILREHLPDIANELNIPVVATNDTHYLNKEDAEAHEALLCISTGTNIYDPKRLRFPSNEMYLKSRDNIWALWPQEYLNNTMQIVDKCNLEIPLGERHHIYEPKSAFKTLKEKCDERIKTMPEEYGLRYEYELSAIEKTGCAEYLGVAANITGYARLRGIPLGAGRGSSAGSLVCYLLGITNIDPIAQGLIFERFINADRVEPPDIDIDVCQARRGEIIDYVKQHYGEDCVAQIISFGTLKTKATIRDTCRVLQLPFILGSSICELIPEPWEGTLEDALKIPGIQSVLSNSITPEQRDKFKYIATKLEGKLRHSSTHAAGIVISDSPLVEATPLYRRTGTNETLTQYDMNSVASLGLLKFDILGLRTLTVIDDTCKAVGIKSDDISLDDEYTYQNLRSGSTVGVFQYEGWGFTRFLERMEPRRFQDLVALGALYRPGPLNSGMADDYIRRKNGEAYEVEYPELKETYGIWLYQEQIMQIVHKLAGFTMNEADTLRKAIGKKDQELMRKMINQIRPRMQERGHNSHTINHTVACIITFSRYGWNKAHAVSYALLSYQTAYLKFNYPTKYFCAVLNSEIHDNKRLITLIKEARECGVTIEPPHINLSDGTFNIHNDRIYAGLMSIKGVGEKACQAILTERQKGEFQDTNNLRERIPPKAVNSRVLDALVAAGVFRVVQESIPTVDIDMSDRSEFDIFQLRELCKQHKGESQLVVIILGTVIETNIYTDNSTKLKNKIKDLGGVLC